MALNMTVTVPCEVASAAVSSGDFTTLHKVARIGRGAAKAPSITANVGSPPRTFDKLVEQLFSGSPVNPNILAEIEALPKSTRVACALSVLHRTMIRKGWGQSMQARRVASELTKFGAITRRWLIGNHSKIEAFVDQGAEPTWLDANEAMRWATKQTGLSGMAFFEFALETVAKEDVEIAEPVLPESKVDQIVLALAAAACWMQMTNTAKRGRDNLCQAINLLVGNTNGATYLDDNVDLIMSVKKVPVAWNPACAEAINAGYEGATKFERFLKSTLTIKQRADAILPPSEAEYAAADSVKKRFLLGLMLYAHRFTHQGHAKMATKCQQALMSIFSEHETIDGADLPDTLSALGDGYIQTVGNDTKPPGCMDGVKLVYAGNSIPEINTAVVTAYNAL